jgi:Asp-tRNA(Asn)/Glu-tRNA(Gln) amidotransferase A subunit family amidase
VHHAKAVGYFNDKLILMENLTIRELVSKYKQGEFDILAWNKAFIKNIKEKEKDIHAWAYFNEEEWLAKLENVLKNHSQKFSNLLGIPVGIKDIFNTIEMPTCMGSPIWAGFTPGNDARVVHNIKFHGGISAGKTVTAEFAVHTPNETRNPWNKEYSPGTSSSGSAAAVAAGMVPLAIGTQTAGSIIRPASYCGVYGFKPSFGTLPRTGILKTTDTLDTIGLFANNIDDCLLLFDAMRIKGLDYPIVHNNLENEKNQQKLGDKWKIGIVLEQHKSSEIISDYALTAFKEYIGSLENNKNYEIGTPSFSPLFNDSHQIHEKIYHKALEYYFKKEFENKSLISPVMYEIINDGKKISVEEYHKNIKLQNVLAQEIDTLFLEYDVLITLSTAGYAPKFGVAIDPQDTCLIWTMCGLPVINIPLFNHNGMPFGLQVIGKKYQDYKLINFVKQLLKG